jgi:hypothetical protein
MPIVYCATNVNNGKRYIGATVGPLSKRQREHKRDSSGPRCFCRIFGAAIRKYGWEAFEWKVLAAFETASAAYDAEIAFIRDLKPEYNISVGGYGLNGVPRTKEWASNISKGLMGKPLSPEHREKAVAACARGRATRHRPVVCLDDGEWFQCMRDAEVFYGLPRASIRQVLDRGQTHTHGLHFVEVAKPISKGERTRLLGIIDEKVCRSVQRRLQGTRKKSVKCVTDGKLYRSAKAAAETYGLNPVTISQKCKDGTPTRQRGLIFSWAVC